MYELAWRVLGFVFRVVWRPTIIGLDHVPATGPVIIASNHLSFVDSVVIPLAVPRRVRFLAKAEYFEGHGLRGRMTAWLFRLVDAVPVRRESRRDAMASLHLAMDVLRDGNAFGIYPEGTRSRDGRLYKGRTGMAWLALESGAPIVPVAVVGTDQVQPVGTRVLRVRPVRIQFGPPVDPAPWLEQLAQRPTGAGRARREVTDAVMDRIAAMSPQVRVDAYNEPPAED